MTSLVLEGFLKVVVRNGDVTSCPALADFLLPLVSWSHSGQSLDQMKMHVCSRVNISDLSLNFTPSTSNTTRLCAIHWSLDKDQTCLIWALGTLGYRSESAHRSCDGWCSAVTSAVASLVGRDAMSLISTTRYVSHRALLGSLSVWHSAAKRFG